MPTTLYVPFLYYKLFLLTQFESRSNVLDKSVPLGELGESGDAGQTRVMDLTEEVGCQQTGDHPPSPGQINLFSCLVSIHFSVNLHQAGSWLNHEVHIQEISHYHIHV